MENVRVPPLGSVVVGVKLYGVPTVPVAGGVPLMVGGEEPPVPPPELAFTVMANAASEALLVPSETEITIPEVVPVWLLVGVPVNAPLVVLKLAQAGLFWIEKLRVPPLGSVVVGVKL